MGLNHIYKVIWSKTKNAWVVVSEIAKRDGKSSVKSVVTSLAGRSVAAVMVAMVMCGGVATANTVYGPGATTGTSTNVTVVGDNAQVDNYSNNAVAIGSNAKTKNGTKSISIGSDSSVDGQFGIAIGAGATLKSASTFESIVIGYNAKNEYADVVIGKNSSAKNYWSTVVGADSSSVGQFSTLVGHMNTEYKALSGAAIQTNANSILGHNNSVMGNYNTILGQQNIVNSSGSYIATGATGVEHNVVVGYANGVRGNQNIVLGMNGTSPTVGDRNIVIGQSSGTSGSVASFDSIGIGSRAFTYNNNAIALGTAVNSNGQTNNYSTSIAIGNGLTSNESIVIGAKGTSDTSFRGMTGSRQSIMVGYTNGLFADNKSVIIGSGNKGDSYSDRDVNNSVILGSSNTVKQHEKQIIVGSNNYVRGKRIVAIGNNINADSTSHDGAVIIGDSSRYSYFDRPSGNITVNGINIDSTKFAGNSSTLTNGNYMSVGDSGKERQIKNVAAGQISSSSTDAVNGSQLYEAVRAVTVGANPDVYMHINDGTATQGYGNSTTNLGKANEKAGAIGTKSIAGGMNAKASGQQSLSLGSYTKSEGDYSVVIGSSHDTSWVSDMGQTFARGNYSVVLGRGAQTLKDNSIAIGHRVGVQGEDSIGIGKYVFTGLDTSLPTERGSGITAVGMGLAVNGTNINVFGQGDVGYVANGILIRANDSTILGNRNFLSQVNSNGYFITPSSINDYVVGSHVLGNDNQVWGNNAIVIGNKSFVYQNSVALGYATKAFGNKSIAVGYGTEARGESSISIGTGNSVLGNKSSAIGDPSYIDTTATGTHVQGNDNGTATNPIKASESTFMGNTNLAGTAGTTGIHVVGNNNSVDSSNVMVMGNNVTVGTGLDGAVVLGHASSADQYAAATDSTINGVTFEAAGYAGNTGLNKGSIVSVGATGAERQIKNVAAGAVTATSRDAVNGSQLYKTAETILKMPINMAGDSGDTVGLKLGKTVNIKGSVASGADVTDGNIAVVGDKATSTLSLKMAKNLTGLTSGTFTDATGNQTVINGAGVTVTPTGTGATPISITTSGINAGNQEIKGVKKGTTDDAAVNKKQMDDALAGISSTLTINDGATDGSVNLKTGKLKVVGESGTNALVTTTVSGDTITVGTSTKLQNAVTAAEKSADKDLSNLSTTGSDKVKTLAQDAVKVAGTGLATVSDATAAGVKTYTVNVDEGKLVIDDTTGKIGAAGATQGTTAGKDGVATTQNVASVVNSAIDKTKQALDDAKHNFAGDDATVISRKHGEQLNIKGGASTTASDLTSGNIAVVGDTTSGTLNIKMAKALTGLTSATYTDGSGNTQTVTGGSSTISDAAGNSTVVSKGGVTTTDAAGNTTTTAPTGVTVTPAGAGATPISVTTSGISAGNKEIKNVGKATTDDAAVNKKQMDDALKGATDNTVSLGSESGTTTAKKLSTTGGIKFNIKGETGANALITTSATGDDVTVAPTAKLTAAVTAAENAANKDLSNLSAAGDTYIKNLAKSAASWNVETNGAGTTAVAGGDTVNFIDGDNIAITNTGRSITIGTAKGETYEVSVSENAVKSVAATAAQDAVKVAGTGLATVSDATAAGVKTYTVNVDEGKLVIDDTTGKLGAAGATQGTVQGKNGVATTQNVADVVNSAIDKTKQALTDAKHDFAGDDATVISRKHGEQLNIKGGASTTATDLTSGNIAVVGDTTSGTLNIKMAKALTGLTSATYTDAAGNTQTVTGGSSTISDAAGNSTVVSKGGVTTTDGTNTTTVAPSGVTATDGTHTVTLGGSGISAGGTEIKNVGKATTDDAAVNKKQMDDAVKAATDSVSTLGDNKVSLGSDSGTTTAKKLSTTGGIKFNIKGETGANALITTSATGDDVTIAPTAKLTAAVTAAEKSADKDLSNISPAGETVIKNLAATSAQDAVKVTGTGLATVSDSTTGGVKTYNVDVKTGNLVVNAAGQAGATGTTGAGGAAGADGVATTQNVATAINDAITKSKTDTAQAIADAEHKFDGDTGTTSVRKHGEVLSVKGGVTATTDLTTGNIGVVSDGAGTLNIRLAKTLTGLTSAAFTDGTHTVTIAGSGIDAGNTEIKHVGKATTDDAAVNKKQMDDAVKAATDSVTTLGDNKVSLGSDSGTTTAKKLSTTGGIKFNIKGDTGANALITTSATGDDVTIAPTAKLSAAVTAAENSANKDLSNLSTAGNTYIQNLAKSAASWNVETNGAGTTAVAGGDTVNFINGDNIAITNTGRAITIGTAKNVSFDKVTVGGVVIDKNNGIDAGGKEITNVGPATSGNSAVNKTQMDTAITNAVNKATTDAKHDFGGDDATVVTRKHGEKLNIKGGASTTAADLTSGNIAVLGDAATGTLNIRMAKALTGLSSATFTTPSGTTVINGGGMTITPSTTGAAPISITTGGINAGNTEIKNVAAGTTPNSAVNKQQMDNAISNATANVGFSTAGNTGTGSVSNGQTLTITGTNGIETNASGQSITVGLDAATRAQINNATTTANNAAKKDLSNIDNAGKQVIKDTAAWNVKVNGAAAEIVKGGDTVTFNDGDNIKVTNTGKDITIATKKDVSFDKVTVGNVVIDKNTNRISGLANAANNDEAVNLGQMNAAISTATAGTGNIKYKANGGTQNSVALTTGFDFKGDSNIQITADPANSGVINYKLNPALTGITSISGGTGAPTITLNAGSGSTPGNVSINSNLDMGGKQINNIGAATHAGDAVNKAQMDQALQNIAGASSNAAKSYAYKAGAGAAALAALKPIQYDPLEPTQIMAGIGNYKSQTAVALGVAHYTNENTMFNLGVSLDSHDGIVNAGVTHKFGYSPEKKAIPDKYKGGPISSIYVMQDEVTALQAIVQKQAAENEALRQQNEDMQRKVDMILSKIH